MLSMTSQYALRALSHMAARPSEALLGRDLAESVEIPANYLSKILLTLRNAGLVATTRGSGGGYRLGRPAEKIYLIDVVELFEDISRTKPSCFLGRARLCSEITPCNAHSSWRNLQIAYLKFLLSTPLADIAAKPEEVWTSSGQRPEPNAGSQQLPTLENEK